MTTKITLDNDGMAEAKDLFNFVSPSTEEGVQKLAQRVADNPGYIEKTIRKVTAPDYGYIKPPGFAPTK